MFSIFPLRLNLSTSFFKITGGNASRVKKIGQTKLKAKSSDPS